MSKKIKLIIGLFCFIAVLAVSMIAAFQIAKANLQKDFKPTSEGKAILTLNYASEKQKEDDVQTTATIIFYDNHECAAEGVISSMYNFNYITTWSAEGGLHIDTAEKVSAECTDEQAIAFLQIIKMKPQYDMNVQHSVSAVNGILELTVEGTEVTEGASLMKFKFVLSQEDAQALGIS